MLCNALLHFFQLYCTGMHCVALCRYGFGVGGEDPAATSATSSTTELDERTPELVLLHRRHDVLVFSNQVWKKSFYIHCFFSHLFNQLFGVGVISHVQGMGIFTYSWVLAVCVVIYGQTGTSQQLTFSGSQTTLALVYGIGALGCLLLVLYRLIYMQESEVSMHWMWHTILFPPWLMKSHYSSCTQRSCGLLHTSYSQDAIFSD